EVVREPTDEVVSAFARLLTQLSTSATPLDHGAVSRMLSHDANTVFMARVAGEIVGTLTLVMVPIPSGLRARIEDVVVDDSARGHGVGTALPAAAIDPARQANRGAPRARARPPTQARRAPPRPPGEPGAGLGRRAVRAARLPRARLPHLPP